MERGWNKQVRNTFFVFLAFSLTIFLPIPSIEASERTVEDINQIVTETDEIDSIKLTDDEAINKDEALDETIVPTSLENDAVSEVSEMTRVEKIEDTGQQSVIAVEADDIDQEELDELAIDEETAVEDQETVEEPLDVEQAVEETEEETVTDASGELHSEESSEVNEPIEEKSSKPERSSLLGLKLGGFLLKPIIGTLNVSLIGIDRDKNSKSSGLLEISIEDSPLLGTLKVSLLGGKNIEKEENDQFERRKGGSLLSIEVDNFLLNNTRIDVLSSERTQSNTESTRRGGLLSANIETPLAGKISASVLGGNQYEAEGESYRSGGLLSVGLDNPLTGNVNVGLLEKDETKSSILSLNTRGLLLLGDTDINIGLQESNRNQSNKSEETPDTTKDRDEQQNLDTEPEPPDETIGNPGQPENPTLPSTDPDKPFENVPNPPELEENDEDQLHLPDQEVTGDDEKVYSEDDKSDTKLDDELFEEYFGEQLSKKDKAFLKSFKELIDASNRTVLYEYQVSEWKGTELDFSEDNPNNVNAFTGSQAVLFGSPSSNNIASGSNSTSGSGSNSSSGSSSSSSVSKGEKLAGYIHQGANDKKLSNVAMSTVKKLRTKWYKDPPYKPPKQSFPLSYSCTVTV